jgi:hypothetical protein
MKRGILAAALVSVVLGWSPSPSAADANVQVANGTDEISERVQGCDEYIDFSGTMREVFVSVVSAADRGFSNDHVEANLAGVGETSGTGYRLVFVRGERGGGGEDGAFGGSYELTFKVVGGGQIFGLEWVARWTRTPNGDITVSFEDVKLDSCSA